MCFLHFFFKNQLFIYFWLCWVLVEVPGLSLAAVSGGLLSLGVVHGLLIVVASRCRAQVQQLWPTGLIATWHVGPS